MKHHFTLVRVVKGYRTGTCSGKNQWRKRNFVRRLSTSFSNLRKSGSSVFPCYSFHAPDRSAARHQRVPFRPIDEIPAFLWVSPSARDISDFNGTKHDVLEKLRRIIHCSLIYCSYLAWIMIDFKQDLSFKIYIGVERIKDNIMIARYI